MGIAGQRVEAEPRPTGWPRAVGGDGKASRQFSLGGAGHWLSNHHAVLENISCVVKTPSLFPSLSRTGLGRIEPEWEVSPFSPLRGAEGVLQPTRRSSSVCIRRKMEIKQYK